MEARPDKNRILRRQKRIWFLQYSDMPSVQPSDTAITAISPARPGARFPGRRTVCHMGGLEQKSLSSLSGHHGQENQNRKKYFLTILSSDRFPFGYPIWSFRFQKGESFIKIGFKILMNNWTGFSSGKPKDLRATVNFTTEDDLVTTKTIRVGFG